MTDSPWLQEHVWPLLDANRRVLLVEGEIDQKVYEIWLDRLAGGRGSPRVPNVVPTESKARVLQHLRALSAVAEINRVWGIVDRDEWDETDCQRRMQMIPGLRVNPHRQCLESYFCDPKEIALALEASPVRSANKAAKAIAKKVKAGLAGWIDHWALWTTLERLKNRMSEAAYPYAFHEGVTPPSDAEVKNKLREWAHMINVERILKEYRSLRKSARKNSPQLQLQSCIFAKNVFAQVIVIEMNKMDTEYQSGEWMPLMAGWFQEVPSQVRAILEPMLEPAEHEEG